MLREDLISAEKTVTLLPRDRQALGCICNYFIIQCILVFVGASTILHCRWSPDHASEDYDKLARIMYLFDSQACGYNLRAARAMANIKLSNHTAGLNVRPIAWTPPVVTVSTRLTAKTRKMMKASIGLHVFWLLVAVIFKLMQNIQRMRILNLLLCVFFYTAVSVIFFDLSMALLYIVHIQQSLTKGMILRYSGWSVEMKLNNYESFGGWLPIAAAICWMRGVIFFGVNVYCCRRICLVRVRIKKREVKKRLLLEDEPPIPEARYEEPMDHKVLYFRSGEKTPYFKK